MPRKAQRPPVRGTRLNKDSVQIAVTFDTRTFNRLKHIAKQSEVSFAEAVRQVVRRGMPPSLKRVA